LAKSVKKRGFDVFLTLAVLGTFVFVLGRANQASGVTDTLQDFARGISDALSNVQKGISSVADPSQPGDAPGNEENSPFIPFPQILGTAREEQIKLPPFTFPASSSFKSLLEQFSPNVNETVFFPQTVRIPTTRQRTSFEAFGISGPVQGITGTSGTFFDPSGVRGNPLAQRATARNQNTLVGNLITSIGGSRTIRGSAGLFERLRSNLNR